VNNFINSIVEILVIIKFVGSNLIFIYKRKTNERFETIY